MHDVHERLQTVRKCGGIPTVFVDENIYSIPFARNHNRSLDDMETLPHVFLALSTCITTITANPDAFKELFSALFQYDWSGGCRARDAYSCLLAHLVSAKSTFVHPVLQMLARSLAAPGPLQDDTAKNGNRMAAEGSGNVQGLIDLGDTNNARKAAVHESLRTVLALVPAGFSELYPVLGQAFPHRRTMGPGGVVNYVRQLLVLATEYATVTEPAKGTSSGSTPSVQSKQRGSGTALGDKLLALILERCLELDVEIKIEDSGEVSVDQADNAAEAGVHAAHDPSAALVLSEHMYVEDPTYCLDIHHPMPGPEVVGEDGAGGGEGGGQEGVVDEMADTLDSVMLLLFQHLDKAISCDGQAASRLFEGLGPVLDGSILATHRCKYVQFAFFYLAARDLSGRVPVLLVDRLLARAVEEDDAPMVTRLAALAYLSSFLVRSRALPVEEIVRALTALLETAEAFLARRAADLMVYMDHAWLKEEDPGSWEAGVVKKEERWLGEEEAPYGGKGPTEEDADGQADDRPVFFYSLCQAIFYVVAFHHSSSEGEDVLGVRAAETGAVRLGGQLKSRLGRLACSPLRPLDHCLESVKREFLRLARLHGLVPWGALGGLGGGEEEEELVTEGNHNPLNSYFPFDPFLLRRSSGFVARPNVYRYWQAKAVSDVIEKEKSAWVRVKEEEPAEGVDGAKGVAREIKDEPCSDESGSEGEGRLYEEGDEESEGSGWEEAQEEEEVEEEERVSWRQASTSDRSGFASAAPPYWPQERAWAAKGMGEVAREAGRRKRVRRDSMDYDSDLLGGGDDRYRGFDEEEEGGTEDEGVEASDRVALAARKGVLLSDHIIEAVAVAASVSRARKESVSSVGSW
ncbi:rna polymerase i-specific transcription initiation factor rrn3 [Nannochloropsis gaditana]|uniref:Rna polymerase i-specific transcription initiation factor rrn3 n=1 Tax=Nannochloropsis gaditana TaxID=72520 RepID=W7TDP0_9STRA|nr:rna polymerase i-specific transcription initiation factor rrn3 [Nannochloropsis gaditana]